MATSRSIRGPSILKRFAIATFGLSNELLTVCAMM